MISKLTNHQSTLKILPPEKRTSLFEAAKEIYKTNGVRGFYQGFNAGIATYAPYVGIYFVVYEQFKRLSISYFNFPSELHLPFYHSLSMILQII